MVPETSGKHHVLTRLYAQENLIEFCLFESFETQTQIMPVENAQTDISKFDVFLTVHHSIDFSKYRLSAQFF